LRLASTGWRTSAFVALLAAALPSCRGGALRGSAPDASPNDARDASPIATPFDAQPPPDDAVPSASSEELGIRARHLLEAITKDDSGLASDILFPRDAWIATRDSVDGGKEWARRVAAPFRRAVHGLSRRHVATDAQFVSLEIGAAIQQETPRRHSWKKPLWTVHDSRITFIVDGRTRVLSIREMTAWRGAWYVTRLR
jgi:hypothetical protein